MTLRLFNLLLSTVSFLTIYRWPTLGLVRAGGTGSEVIPGFDNSPITQQWYRPGQLSCLHCITSDLWEKIFTIIYLILGSLAVLLLIIAGLQYITAAGNPEKLKRARQSILQIILGIVVLVSSYAIIALILGLASYLGT